MVVKFKEVAMKILDIKVAQFGTNWQLQWEKKSFDDEQMRVIRLPSSPSKRFFSRASILLFISELFLIKHLGFLIKQ